MCPSHSTRAAGPPCRAWLILPVLGAGLFFACVAVLVRSSRTTHTVSQVTRQIHQIALYRHRGGADLDDGGSLGPWWIAAGSLDPGSGELHDFRVSSGRMEIAARRARLVVDPDQDTFLFELYDVVLTRVPASDGSEPDHYLVSREHHTLGPVPYGADIVVDSELR